MKKRIGLIIGVLVLCGLPSLSGAAPFNGSDPMVCATIKAMECLQDGGCKEVTLESLALPPFVVIDAEKMEIRPTVQSDINRVSAIERKETVDGKLILQGAEDGLEDVRDGLGWTIAIGEETGSLVLTASGDGLAFVVYGACTLLGETGPQNAAWGYEGEAGPAHWASLSPEFSGCAGSNQSPIDLVTAEMIEADLEPITFDYKSVPLEVINNGHTIQVNYASGSRIILDGIPFELKQFHFHNPSENRIAGQAYAMEGHLVHADDEGNLAVVAVLFEEGAENDFLAQIWNRMPKDVGGKAAAQGETLSADELLPPDKDYYRFNGSLTTPPCTEGVRWMVLKSPAAVSKEQADAFHHVMHHDNNRPVQQVNARPVLK